VVPIVEASFKTRYQFSEVKAIQMVEQKTIKPTKINLWKSCSRKFWNVFLWI